MLFYTVEYKDPATFLEDFEHLKHAGLILEVEELPPISSEIELELRLLPDPTSMMLRAKVLMHVTEKTVALQFETLTAEQQALLYQSEEHCRNLSLHSGPNFTALSKATLYNSEYPTTPVDEALPIPVDMTPPTPVDPVPSAPSEMGENFVPAAPTIPDWAVPPKPSTQENVEGLAEAADAAPAPVSEPAPKAKKQSRFKSLSAVIPHLKSSSPRVPKEEQGPPTQEHVISPEVLEETTVETSEQLVVTPTTETETPLPTVEPTPPPTSRFVATVSSATPRQTPAAPLAKQEELKPLGATWSTHEEPKLLSESQTSDQQQRQPQPPPTGRFVSSFPSDHKTPPPPSRRHSHTPPPMSAARTGSFISQNPREHWSPPPLSAVPPSTPPPATSRSGSFISANPEHHRTPPPLSAVSASTTPPTPVSHSGSFISANPEHHRTPPPLSAVPASTPPTTRSGSFISANPDHHRTPPPLSAVPPSTPPPAKSRSGSFVSVNPEHHRTPLPLSAVPVPTPPPSAIQTQTESEPLTDTLKNKREYSRLMGTGQATLYASASSSTQPAVSLTPPPLSAVPQDAEAGFALAPPQLPAFQNPGAQAFTAPRGVPPSAPAQAQTPSWTGHFSETSMVSALSQLGQHNATGTLHVDSEDGQHLECYLNKGRVVAVVAEPPDETLRLGELLVEEGILKENHRDIALRKTEGTERPLGDVLREEQWLTKKQLATTLRTQMYRRLRPFLHMEEAQFAFWEQRRPEGVRNFSPPTAPLRLLLRGAIEEIEKEAAEVSAEFDKQYNSRYLFQEDAPQEEWDALQLSQDEKTFLETMATGQFRFREALTTSSLRRRQAYAFVRALHELALVRFEKQQSMKFRLQEMMEKFSNRHALIQHEDIYEFIGTSWASTQDDLQEAMERIKTEYDISHYEGDWPEEITTMSEEILSYLKELRKKFRGGKRPIPPSTRSSPAQIRSSIKLLEEQADMAVYRRNFQQAIEFFTRILDLVPTSQKHKDKIKACKEALRKQAEKQATNKGKDVDFAEKMKVDLSALGFEEDPE